MNKRQRLLSTELRGFFLKEDYPIPFGLLDNSNIDKLPMPYKKIMADAFYRAWLALYSKNGNSYTKFNLHAQGRIYRRNYTCEYLSRVAHAFEDMGYIRKFKGSQVWYEINSHKFLNNRDM